MRLQRQVERLERKLLKQRRAVERAETTPTIRLEFAAADDVVDGAEMVVLGGATETLASDVVQSAFVELAAELKQLVDDLLFGHGFRREPLYRSGETVDSGRVPQYAIYRASQ